MKTKSTTAAGWIVATFSLLALFLVSVSANLNTENSTAEKVNSDALLDTFIGEIIMFGGNFAPRGWAFCNGQLLPIAQNQSLYSILGTTYGGDGRTTFALPDLRGRVPIHAGRGPGLTPYQLGQKGGSETISFTKAVKVASTNSRANNAVDAKSRVDNLPPYQTVHYIIALQGVYPSRN